MLTEGRTPATSCAAVALAIITPCASTKTCARPAPGGGLRQAFNTRCLVAVPPLLTARRTRRPERQPCSRLPPRRFAAEVLPRGRELHDSASVARGCLRRRPTTLLRCARVDPRAGTRAAEPSDPRSGSAEVLRFPHRALESTSPTVLRESARALWFSGSRCSCASRSHGA